MTGQPTRVCPLVDCPMLRHDPQHPHVAAGTSTTGRSLPVLPYGGEDDRSSGYAAGVATSEARARREDTDGTTRRRQADVIAPCTRHHTWSSTRGGRVMGRCDPPDMDCQFVKPDADGRRRR